MGSCEGNDRASCTMSGLISSPVTWPGMAVGQASIDTRAAGDILHAFTR
jgi:hypothetical protein